MPRHFSTQLAIRKGSDECAYTIKICNGLADLYGASALMSKYDTTKIICPITHHIHFPTLSPSVVLPRHPHPVPHHYHLVRRPLSDHHHDRSPHHLVRTITPSSSSPLLTSSALSYQSASRNHTHTSSACCTLSRPRPRPLPVQTAVRPSDQPLRSKRRGPVSRSRARLTHSLRPKRPAVVLLSAPLLSAPVEAGVRGFEDSSKTNIQQAYKGLTPELKNRATSHT
ncbi:hypothetical protein V8E36_006071 [Tilletia maclaganii]